ncbi:MAG TPA: diguanylate cyclase [Gemmatimonadaceae bacterium]|nr:diguanylate cyclase [Gemmatimonadaceae bacterium]
MRILIADDDAVSRRLLEGTLTRLGHEVVSVTDGAAAAAALLAPDGPRLAILDWVMPEMDGLAVCQKVRAASSTYVYMILLSARDGPEDMVTGLDAGADDFLTKPFNGGELCARLRSGTRVLELQAGLLRAQEALRAESKRDDLTGLGNRRMILEQLGREINRARHERRPLAVALADLDRFKQINDTYGHAAGDAVLRETAAALRTQLREYDFIGRYGGEEFLVLLPGADARTGTSIAERLRGMVASEPVHWGAESIAVSISIGLTWTGNAGFDADGLIQSADEALYRAKANGRNRVECEEIQPPTATVE